MKTIFKSRSRLLALVLVFCMLFGVMAYYPGAATVTEAEETTDGNSDGTDDGSTTGEEEEPEVVPVTSVKLNKKSAKLRVGKSITLKATVLPADATNKKVTWKCNSKYKAVVTNTGKVYATYKGTVKITATTEDGKKVATCKIKIKKPSSKDSAAYSLYLMNKERKKKKIAPLILDTKLKKASKLRAKELTRKMSKKRPNGKKFTTALDKYNIEYDHAGQNIAAGYTKYIYATYGWLGSKKNYKNIMNRKFKKVYIARKKVSKGYRFYYVQLFTD